MPKVSIIMGIYNCEDTLAKAIDSILEQTYTSWELIMCDDCSTDGTYEIAKSYQEQYPDKIILLKNEVNKKLAFTLNHCLSCAKGEYIARMDGDDVSQPTRLQKQVEFLNSHHEIDCVGTGRIIFDDEGEYGTFAELENPTKLTIVKHVPFAHPTIMMKASVYKALGGYTVSKATLRAEDADLWYRFFASGYKGYVIQEPLYRYRESKQDFKKRTLKAAIGARKVKLNGYRLLGVPRKMWILAWKPVLIACIPKGIMFKYHRKRYKKEN